MRELDEMMALVPIKELKELKKDRNKKEDLIEFHNEVFKNLELFLTYWYENTKEFGKIKDDFNQNDEFPCELVRKNGRIKVKMNKNNES